MKNPSNVRSVPKLSLTNRICVLTFKRIQTPNPIRAHDAANRLPLNRICTNMKSHRASEARVANPTTKSRNQKRIVPTLRTRLHRRTRRKHHRRTK